MEDCWQRKNGEPITHMMLLSARIVAKILNLMTRSVPSVVPNCEKKDVMSCLVDVLRLENHSQTSLTRHLKNEPQVLTER
jgi:hypothetical protein